MEFQSRSRSRPTTKGSKFNSSLVSSAGIAIILHLSLVFVIGGIVIFEGKVPPIFFEGSPEAGGPIEEMEAPPLLEEEILPEPQAASNDAVTEEIAADAIDLTDLVVSSAPSLAPAFKMPLSVGNPNITKGSIGGLTRGTGRTPGPGFGGSGSGILTKFGYKGQVEGTLKGSLFDTKQDPKGKALVTPAELADRDFLINRMSQISKEFTSGNWNSGNLQKKFFKADLELYSSFWIIGKVSAEEAPKAFGVEDQVEAKSIMAHYEGTFTPEESGEFRFLAKADDIIVVRMDGKIVVDGSYYNNGSTWRGGTGKGPNLLGLSGFPPNFGDWMSWEAGKPIEMNVLIGESPGGVFGCCLLYQKKGEEKLRVFSTKPLTKREKKNLKDISPQIEDWL